MDNITVRAFDDWMLARHELASFPRAWAFRGQRDSTWRLCTSLERVASHSTMKIRDLETIMTREFMRRAHHYLSFEAIPKETDQVAWLALMQHHGAPTRLLDWTRSPYIAAYFALEEADDKDPDPYAAIWAIDLDWCRRQGIKALKALGGGYRQLSDKPMIWAAEYVAALFSNKCPGGFPVCPFSMNERLATQQGLFIMPGDLGCTFEENLQALDDGDLSKKVVKMLICKTMRAKVISDLHQMNINRATLFPGIDGFAQSLRFIQDSIYSRQWNWDLAAQV